MKFMLPARLLLILLSAGLCAALLPSPVLRAEDEKETKAEKAADKPVDRYSLPTGGVKELEKFIQDVREFQPENTAQAFEHREKALPAIRAAAEKILTLEKDKTSDSYRNAFHLVLAFRLRDVGDLKPAEQLALLNDVLGQLKGKDFDDEDVRLGISAAQGFEDAGADKLAADMYQSLAKLLSESKKARYAEVAKVCEASGRRLALPGNPIKIEGTRLDGKKFNITSLKGKVVLVDFWATWCGPCRAEFPNVLEQYDKYKDRGFEVVGISIDENRGELEAYVAEKKVPWITLHDQTEEGNPVANYYGIIYIPQMILVGRDGKVLSLEARGEELNRLLAEQFRSPEKGDEKKEQKSSGE